MPDPGSTQETIEDIILSNDQRGMTALRPHLPDDFCMQAAKFLYDRPGTVFIVTGFYEIVPHVIETDGPPGALAVGRALEKINHKVVYVGDRHGVPFLEPEADDAEVVAFPITTPEESHAFARSLLDKYKPSVVVAIERCSVTESGRYLNMPRQDIAAYNARTDYLFEEHPDTVGIGDGGNEIGMGKLKDIIPTVPNLPDAPALTATTHLVITSVSNWGGYGFAASLSMLSGKNLLPYIEEDQALIRKMVDLGGVDGMENAQVYKVDGFTLDENSKTLQMLHDYLAERGVM